MGVLSDVEPFHKMMIEERRSQKFDLMVSLCWNRTDNEYIISTDAGRICRVLYREGIKPQTVKGLKTWSSIIEKCMDYVDSQETEGLLVKPEPFDQIIIQKFMVP